jgi:hypothetical protein
MSAARMGVSCLLALIAAVATAAVTPAQKCQSKKNQIAGKYSECRQKAEGKLALDGDASAYGASITKCLARYADKWDKAKPPRRCRRDVSGVRSVVDQAVAATPQRASALAGDRRRLMFAARPAR